MLRRLASSLAAAARLTDNVGRTLYGPEHEQFARTVQRFFAEHVLPHHTAWEARGYVSREVFRAAGSLGLLGVCVPTEYGGAGGDIADLWDEQGRTGLSGPGFIVHSDIVCMYLAKYATDAVRTSVLPALRAGERIGAIAMISTPRLVDIERAAALEGVGPIGKIV